MSDLKESLVQKYNRYARLSKANKERSFRVALGYGDYLSYGYWTGETETGHQAGEALMERLCARIPVKTGRILDVACGLGATSQYLLKYYPAENITGINLADEQIDYCREKIPGAQFRVMKAESLDFEDASFDTVICVEAAFHFETRLDFFREALRVLKPSGRLVLSDILADVEARQQPSANRIASFEQYRAVFEAAGFVSVEIEDATQQAVMRQTEVSWELIRRLFKDGEISRARFEEAKRKLISRRRHMSYVLASAEKP